MGRQEDCVKTMAISLLNWSDDHGYFYADPAAIRSFARPFDDDSKMTLGCLQKLMEIEYLEVRQHTSRGFIGRVVSFEDHQRVDKPKPSTIKKFYDESVSVIVLGSIRDESKINPAGKEGKGKELKEEPRSSKTDSRYEPFVEALSKYWKHKNPELKFTVSKADGKNLKLFLAANSDVTIEQFQTCLQHRGRSDVVHSQAICRWIGRTLEFFNGPLDQFWKPLGNKATVKPNGEYKTVDANAEIEQRRAEKRAREAEEHPDE